MAASLAPVPIFNQSNPAMVETRAMDDESSAADVHCTVALVDTITRMVESAPACHQRARPVRKSIGATDECIVARVHCISATVECIGRKVDCIDAMVDCLRGTHDCLSETDASLCRTRWSTRDFPRRMI